MNNLNVKLNDLDAVAELMKQAMSVMEASDILVNPSRTIRLFNNVLLKFNYYYTLVYNEIELEDEEYDFLRDVSPFIENIPQTEFLYRIAICVDNHIRYDLNPARCFRNPFLIDDFILFFQTYCPIIQNQINPNDDEMLIDFDKLNYLIEIEKFSKVLELFIGEWRNNEFENIFENVIPPEF